MYLKSIEISGFKSFAKKSVLDFHSPITAIVGPNGSGKSNTAEAFRFVLGEQSKKRMRSQKSEDLLWVGSNAVPRANRARVSILFDNTADSEGNRLFDIDFDEVKVERGVFRDGEHEYMINGSKVRLKDVATLLASAGIGASGHHIISQGEADRILGASARERKEMIEEALGLNVYKYRKVESERKLEKTLENIKDAKSLHRELAPHLLFLERQMEKLARARELGEHLGELYERYIHAERVFIRTEHARLKEDVLQPREELAAIQTKIATAQQKSEHGVDTSAEERELSEVDKEITALTEQKGALERELGRVEGALAFAHESSAQNGKENEVQVGASVIENFLEKVLKALEGENEVTRARAVVAGLCKDFISSVLKGGHASDENTHTPDTTLLEHERDTKQKAIAELDNTLARARDKRRAIEVRISTLRESLHGTERALYEYKVQEDALQAKLSRIEHDAEELARNERALEHIINEARERNITIKEENQEEQTLSRDERDDMLREIERTKARLEEAGGVDVETVREHEETKERSAFLEREIADLEHSRASLLTIIKELDLEMENRFSEGMEKINTAFGTFFATLFDGGKADIMQVEQKVRGVSEEEGEESPTEIGIEIKVQLPRKKASTLDVLSGGERALTSIALIFAMSQVNPPPFIILDETDAALDEANSRRYADMVRALSRKSQLILITHNRQTMSAAGELYGVTMGGDGVSKLLSVKFDEAVQVAK